MQWCTNHITKKEFPHAKFKQLVKNYSGSRSRVDLFRLGLHGFADFIVPYTPTTWSSTWAQPESVWNYVVRLLNYMSIIDDAISQPTALAVHSELVPLWPTVWFWCQALHEMNVLARMSGYGQEEQSIRDPARYSRSACQTRHAALLKALKGFSHHKPPTKLSILVNGTDGFIAMLAQLWIDEGRYAIWAGNSNSRREALYGFKAGSLIHTLDGGRASETSVDLVAQIITSCGGAEAAVEVLFQRVQNNLAQSSVCLQSFTVDLLLLNGQILRRTESGDALLPALVGHSRTVSFLVETLYSLLIHIRHMRLATDILCMPLLAITSLIRQTNAYSTISQLLDTRFFEVMAYVVPLCSAKTQDMTGPCKDLLHNLLPRYTVFRSLFVRMQRSFSNSGASFDRKFKPGGLAFESTLAACRGLFREYQSAPSYTLQCSNPEVNDQHPLRPKTPI
ncbi:hypothetical protein HWV62_25717 [Athelia sp. TMB]|nr:hypothetical protein HWV62_25717 [Athelia sp. TMB]